jgi:hypothetical protein
LSDDGILITQVGIGPQLLASSEDHSIHKNRVRFFETLVELDFGSVRDYSEVRRSQPVKPFQILECLTSRNVHATCRVIVGLMIHGSMLLLSKTLAPR